MSRAFPLCVRIHLRITPSLDTEWGDKIVLGRCFLHGRHFGRPIATPARVEHVAWRAWWIGLNDSKVESALHDGARRTRDHACVRSQWRRPTVQGCTRATPLSEIGHCLDFSDSSAVTLVVLFRPIHQGMGTCRRGTRAGLSHTHSTEPAALAALAVCL